MDHIEELKNAKKLAKRLRMEYIDKYTQRSYEILDRLPKFGTLYRPCDLIPWISQYIAHREAREVLHDKRPCIFKFQDAVQWVAFCLPGWSNVPAIQDIIHTYIYEKGNQ